MSMTVVFDVDGVILDYMIFFEKFMREKGIIPIVSFNEESDWGLSTMFPPSILEGKSISEYIFQMNNSPEYFGNIPYINGAVETIKFFHSNGVNIELLTSCGNDTKMKKLREKNLKEILPYVSKLTILPLGANKKEFLSKYDYKTLFFDDHEKNCQDGLDVGLDVYRVKRGIIPSSIGKTVVNWNDIYHIINGKINSNERAV